LEQKCPCTPSIHRLDNNGNSESGNATKPKQINEKSHGGIWGYHNVQFSE